MWILVVFYYGAGYFRIWNWISRDISTRFIARWKMLLLVEMENAPTGSFSTYANLDGPLRPCLTIPKTINEITHEGNMKECVFLVDIPIVKQAHLT